MEASTTAATIPERCPCCEQAASEWMRLDRGRGTIVCAACAHLVRRRDLRELVGMTLCQFSVVVLFVSPTLWWMPAELVIPLVSAPAIMAIVVSLSNIWTYRRPGYRQLRRAAGRPWPLLLLLAALVGAYAALFAGRDAFTVVHRLPVAPPVDLIVLSSDGERLALGSSQRSSLEVWSTVTGARLHAVAIPVRSRAAGQLAISPDLQRAASIERRAGGEFWLCVRDLGTGTVAWEQRHAGVLAVAFGPGGDEVRAVSTGGGIRAWDSAGGALRGDVAIREGTFEQATFHANGSVAELRRPSAGGVVDILLADSGSGAILCELRGRSPSTELAAGRGGVPRAERDADGELLWVSDRDRGQRSLDRFHARFARAVRILGDNCPLLIEHSNGLYVFDPTDRRVPLKLDYTGYTARVSRDLRLLVEADGDSVRIRRARWDPRSPLGLFNTPAPWAVVTLWVVWLWLSLNTRRPVPWPPSGWASTAGAGR